MSTKTLADKINKDPSKFYKAQAELNQLSERELNLRLDALKTEVELIELLLDKIEHDHDRI